MNSSYASSKMREEKEESKKELLSKRNQNWGDFGKFSTHPYCRKQKKKETRKLILTFLIYSHFLTSH